MTVRPYIFTLVISCFLLTSCSGKVPVMEVIRSPEQIKNYEEVEKEAEAIVIEQKEDRALILTYHNFSHNISDGSTVQISEFAEQMQYLKDNNYNVTTLGELFNYLDGDKKIPAKSIVITMDDGWLSVKNLALPILKKHNFPATLFIYSDIVDESKRFVTWDDLKELMASGMDIQCHSKSHGNLRKYLKKKNFRELLAQEFGVVQKTIEEKLGTKCNFFAYPFGKFSKTFFPILEEYGYRGAVTVNMGFVERDYEKFRVNRASIFGEYDLDVFKYIVNLNREPVFYKRKKSKSSESIILTK